MKDKGEKNQKTEDMTRLELIVQGSRFIMIVSLSILESRLCADRAGFCCFSVIKKVDLYHSNPVPGTCFLLVAPGIRSVGLLPF